MRHYSLRQTSKSEQSSLMEECTLGLKSNRVIMIIYVGFAYNSHKLTNFLPY